MIAKDELARLIFDTTDEVLANNPKIMEHIQMDGLVKDSVQLSVMTTIKVLQKLDVIDEIK